ncbi:MAG: M23 family metallopeptidase [Sporomusaceae bacterium]|nr:M23 family metallopeptidase [Sporomusaceae bacterium]
MPKEEQTSKSIRIPMTIAKYAAGVLCLLIVLTIGAFADYRQTLKTASADKAELASLRQTNDDQVKQIEQLGKATAILQADMDRLNALDAELRRIVNNEDGTTTSRAGLIRPSAPFNGQGGPGAQLDRKKIDQMVSHLQEAVTVREESLTELKDELLAKRARYAARPSIWPTSGDVTSRFGWRNSPMGRGSDYHPGIDIANSTGTPIVATADGVVVQSEWYSGYGETVQVDHGNGIVTLYAHNSQRAVHDGQFVKKGQLIAYLGNTGYSTGPHLHYEVRVNGTAVNPASFLNE